MSLAIDVANISKSYRRYRPDRPMMLQEVLARGLKGFQTTELFWALRDVSFSVERGRAVGIIGTNGSGKSTLLRLVGGIGSADTGRVRVAGRIGALLDLGSGIHPDLTGRENVIVAGVLSGLSRREVLRRFDDIVDFSEIGKFIDNPMRTYSSGMQMRLAFAINVHTNPDVLLIDEVLAVGDAAFQRKCLTRIKAFKANGCSILLVSHGLGVVQQLCDEVIWMHYGQKMAQGPVRDVVRQYETHAGVAMELELLDETDAGPAAPPPAPARVVSPSPAATGAVRIARAALLDQAGHGLAAIRSGQGVRIEIEAEADADAGTVGAATYHVRVVREDGLVCCEFATSAPPSRPLTLSVDRLDLNAGHYSVDIVATDTTGAAGQPVGVPLAVSGDGARESVLSVPHHWEA